MKPTCHGNAVCLVHRPVACGVQAPIQCEVRDARVLPHAVLWPWDVASARHRKPTARQSRAEAWRRTVWPDVWLQRTGSRHRREEGGVRPSSFRPSICAPAAGVCPNKMQVTQRSTDCPQAEACISVVGAHDQGPQTCQPTPLKGPCSDCKLEVTDWGSHSVSRRQGLGSGRGLCFALGAQGRHAKVLAGPGQSTPGAPSPTRFRGKFRWVTNSENKVDL